MCYQLLTENTNYVARCQERLTGYETVLLLLLLLLLLLFSQVFLRSGADIKVNAYGAYVNLYLTIPSDDSGRTVGQCANNNNNANDEYSNEEVFKNSMM